MNSRPCTAPTTRAARLGLALLAALAAAPAPAADPLDADALRALLLARFPEHVPDRIRRSPLPQLYEVVYGGEVLYVSEDGRHLLRGADLFELAGLRNLTDAVRADARAQLLADYGTDRLVVYPARGERRHAVTVVTDIDCMYCRKLHAHIEELRNRGIEVRYLFFPRTGQDTPSYDKAVSVWCASDRLDALTRAKRLEPLEPRTCANPVVEHMELVENIGIASTPTIFRADGAVIRGYRPPQELQALLEEG